MIFFYLNESLRNNNVITGGRRKTALTLEDVKHVTAFLMHFGDQHGMVLPGRVPGFARDDLRVLPSHYTRKAIWQLYTDADSPAVIRKVKLRSFSQLWKQLLPFIVVAKPMSDLCWTCQQNNTRVVRYVSGSHWTNYEQSKIIKLGEYTVVFYALSQRRYIGSVYRAQCWWEGSRVRILLEELCFWTFGNSVYPTLSVSFGGDTQIRQSLLAGVYMPGEVKKNTHGGYSYASTGSTDPTLSTLVFSF